jgi:hypothetical protein
MLDNINLVTFVTIHLKRFYFQFLDLDIVDPWEYSESDMGK